MLLYYVSDSGERWGA